MKKTLMGIVLTAFLAIGLVNAATTVDTTWNGGGTFHTTFVAGDDARTELLTSGSLASGEFHATDADNNPYGYNVDSFNTWTKARVSSGFIESTTERLASQGMYGPAGQTAYSLVSSDGVAELAYNADTNYASMTNNQYGQPTWTTNGYQFEATGTNFQIVHELTDSDNDGANLVVSGTGFGGVKLMADTAAGSAFNFGSLPVAGHGEAWDNNFAKYVGDGVGVVTLNAWSNNGLDLHDLALHVPGNGVDDSAQAHLSFSYAGSFVFKDFGVKGN